MWNLSRPTLIRYGAAVLAVALAVLVRLALDPVLGVSFPFSTLFFTVLVVAGFFGRGPALLTTALGALVSARVLLPPRDGFAVRGAENQAGMALYLFISLGIALLGGGLRAARRRAEESAAAARRQGEQLRVTLSSVGDGVIATDARGRVVFLNSVAEALTGWRSAEAEGQRLTSVFRAVDEATRQPLDDLGRRAQREGAVVGLPGPSVLIARDGTERAVEDSAAPIRDASGAVIGSVLVFRDVDRRRRADKALAESEARKSAILRSALDAVISIDHEGKIVEFNPAAEKTFGHAESDVVGRELADLIIPPALREAHRRGMAHYLATGEGPVLGRRIEVTALRADGTEFPTELAITRITTSDPPMFTAHVRDVTDRKRAEKELRESEGRFRTMAESIAQLAWMARPDGHIDWYNRRWYEYTGTTPEEMQGWGWQKVHDPEALPLVLERWKASIATGEPFDMVFPLRGADGKFRPFLTRIAPVRGDDGRLAHWFGTNTDISDRLRVEEELRAAKEGAEAANRAKDQFLAALSHELRTPLNPVLLATTALLERPGPPEDILPTLEMIKQYVSLQARLIDDLLDVTHILRGNLPLRKGLADAHDLIRHAVEVCRDEIQDKNLRLETELSAPRHHVQGDPARLQQVLWNLLRNAVKFSDPGGAIAVQTRNEGDGGKLVVEVADSGIGIEPDVLPRIFDPFRQGETTVIRRYGGLGLGLAISRNVVEAHGGTLTVESPGTGRGATFRVELATAPEPAALDESPRPADPHAAAPSRKILLVEDEPATLRLLGRLLRSLGHEVTSADTLATAWEAARTGMYDLIVSDIGLPDGSGLDLMRRITAERGAVPAIALTGFGTDQDVRRSREVGFAVHMTKPIDFAALKEVIHAMTA